MDLLVEVELINVCFCHICVNLVREELLRLYV